MTSYGHIISSRASGSSRSSSGSHEPWPENVNTTESSVAGLPDHGLQRLDDARPGGLAVVKRIDPVAALFEQRLPVLGVVDAAGEVHVRPGVVVDADTKRTVGHRGLLCRQSCSKTLENQGATPLSSVMLLMRSNRHTQDERADPLTRVVGAVEEVGA